MTTAAPQEKKYSPENLQRLTELQIRRDRWDSLRLIPILTGVASLGLFVWGAAVMIHGRFEQNIAYKARDHETEVINYLTEKNIDTTANEVSRNIHIIDALRIEDDIDDIAPYWVSTLAGIAGSALVFIPMSSAYSANIRRIEAIPVLPDSPALDGPLPPPDPTLAVVTTPPFA